MFKLKTYKNQKISEIQLVQILFYTFPLTFIVGNLIVSLHSLIFIIASLFLIKSRELNYRFNNLYWFLSIFLSQNCFGILSLKKFQLGKVKVTVKEYIIL